MKQVYPKLENYTILDRLYLGDKEIVMGIDKEASLPFMVCDCTYKNAYGVAPPSSAVATDDYLEAMDNYADRLKAQIEQVQYELAHFCFDLTPFTEDDCILDDREQSVVGKVIVIKADSLRMEYRHSAYQLIYVEGGQGANGGRGSAVFGTCLATGKKGRWERRNVLGEIRPERMPAWAKEKLAEHLREQQKRSKQREAMKR